MGGTAWPFGRFPVCPHRWLRVEGMWLYGGARMGEVMAFVFGIGWRFVCLLVFGL